MKILLFAAILWSFGSYSLLAQSSGPPQITVQPQDQSVNSGSNAVFSVTATGAAPLRYQWRAEAGTSGVFTNILRGTNFTLAVSNVNLLTARKYSVVVTNTLGAVTSVVAELNLDADLSFRILALRTNGYIALEVNNVVSDDRGGMAVSATNVFLTGDGTTGRWRKQDLTGGASAGQQYDALTTDLRTEKAYTLANGNTPLRYSGSSPGLVTALIELSDNGAVTTNRITLSPSITLVNFNIGFFAGYGRVVLYDNGRYYNIAIPSGVVTDLGFKGYLNAYPSENWGFAAFWGVTEYFRGELYVLYGQYSTGIARTRLSDGITTTPGNFGYGLGDLASFTFSPSLSRWFFHYESGFTFGSRDETLGSAKALFTTDPGYPEIVQNPFSQTVYAGTSAVMSVIATGRDLVYQWIRNGLEIPDATNANLVLTNVLPSDAGDYVVTVSNPAGALVTTPVFLTVISMPIIFWGPYGASINATEDVQFQVGVDGAPPLTFYWLFNGTNFFEGTNSILQLTNVPPEGEGYYSVLVSNVYGVAISQNAYLTVNTQVWISAQPLSETVVAGTSLDLYVVAYGAAPISFQWFFNGMSMLNETNSVLSRAGVEIADQGTYTVLVSNPWMSVLSDPALLTVISVPSITNQPASMVVFPGGTATFTVGTIGPEPLSYQWLFNGSALTDATTPSIFLSNVTANVAGLYSVVVSNSYGSVTSAPALLTLTNPLPQNASFRIVSLTTNNLRSVETSQLAGDDKGGIAASIARLFYSGDFWTAHFKLADLSDGRRLQTQFNTIYDSMVGDIRTAKAYVLVDSNNFPVVCCGFTATHLVELDDETGLTNLNRIPLSAPIGFSPFYDSNVGFFSGYGRVLVHNTTNVYSILLPSGTVSNLGPLTVPLHLFAESWAYWGVAEYYRGTNYLVYVRDSQSIVRTRLPDGLTTTLAPFSNLGDMASFTVSPFYNRWYFHQQFGGEITTLYETVSYADAVLEVNSVDRYEWSAVPSPQVAGAPFTVSITAKGFDNTTVTNLNGPLNLTGLETGGQAVVISPGSASNFVNGVWTGQITVTQATPAMRLVATDALGTAGTSGQFAVFPLDDLFVSVTDSPDPVVVAQPLLYTITVSNTGPTAATGVMLTNFVDSSLQVEQISSTAGSCSNSGGVISCDLGTVPGATGVTILIQVTPSAVGSITNRAIVRRAESDSNAANDSAVAVTTVTLPGLAVSDASLVEGESGTNLMTFAVTLSGPPTNTVTVNFFTLNGLANSATDYVTKNGSLTFPPGVTNQTVQIGVRGDILFETNETFSVVLNSPVNAVILRTTGVGTIINDDAPPVVSIEDASLVEGNSGTNNMAFRVRLSAPTGVQILVGYATSNGTATAGSDYLPLSSVLSFGANTLTLTQTVNVPIIADTAPEYAELLYVNLTSISNGIGGKVQGLGTIVNDDGIGVLDHFAFDPVGAEQAVNIPFSARITAKDFFNSTVSNFNGNTLLSAVVPQGDPTNYALGNIPHENFGSGNWTLGYSFTPARDITVTHLRHYFGVKASIWTDAGTLVVSQAFSGPDGFWSETPLPAPVVLSRGVRYRIAAYTGNNGNYYWSSRLITSFADGAIDEGYEVAGDNFPISNDGIRWFVDFRYSVESALVLTPTNSIFTNGVWSGPVTVLAPGTNVVLRVRDTGGRKGESTLFNVIPADLSVSITDTPDPVVAGELLTYSILVTNTGPTAATGVVLSNFLASTVSVQDIATSVGSCANDGGIVRCDLGTMLAATSATIAIRVTPGALGSVTNRVTVMRLETDAYVTNNSATAITTVTLPALAISDASMLEGDSGTNVLTFNVALVGRSTNTITVNFSTFNGTASGSSDYIGTNGSLSFAPGVTNQTVQIRVRGDTLYETNETFSLGLNSVVNGIISRNTGIGTILNDDAAPVVSISDAGLVEGNSGTNNMAFRVRLSAPTGLQILVSYATSNGTATALAPAVQGDFLPLSNVLSFGANSLNLTQTINVPILGDTVAEYDEFFYLNILNVSNGIPGRVQATGTITNEDGFGVLDHFAFDPIGSPQGVSLPFPVTIRAEDFFGTTVTNFAGDTELSALVSGSGRATNLLGNLSGDNSFNGEFSLGNAFTPTNDVTVTHFRHLFGTKISLWTDNGALLATKNITNAPGTWAETVLTSPVKLTAGKRYRIGAFSGSGGGTIFYTFSGSTNFPDGTIEQAYYASGDAFPTNFDSPHWWLVDLRYRTDALLTVAPTNLATFTNGVWSGTLAVLSRGTNVELRATDTNQHAGVSNPFSVVPADQADLRIALSPASLPARYISNFVFSIHVTNAGPANATEVWVSNSLPAQLEFLSAISPGGFCFYSNGLLTCSVGILPSQSSSDVVVTTRPLAAGSISIQGRVKAFEPDPDASNNSTPLAVSICRDCDGDGIWDDWEMTHDLNPLDLADGGLDPDQDGHTSLEEFLAGTDPHSSNSVTRISQVLLTGNDVRIRFQGIAGKRYQLERNDGMSGSNWTGIVTFKVGSSQMVELIDSSAMRRPSGFYRVRLLNVP